MRKLALFLAFTSSVTVFCQIDSLKKLMPTTESDTALLELYNEIAFQITMSYSDLDSAKFYCEKCIAKAKAINHELYEARCTYSLAIACDVNGDLTRALGLLDSAEVMFVNLDNLAYVGNVKNARGAAYYFQGLSEKALSNYLQALAYGEEHNLPVTSSQALNNIGVIYRESGKYDEAVSIYKRSIHVKRGLNDTRGIANTFKNLAIANDRLGNLELALANFDSALVGYQVLGDNYEYGSTEVSIGEVHFNNGELDKALEMIESGLSNLAESPRDQRNYAFGQLLVGEVLRLKGRSEEALPYYNEAESILGPSERIETKAALYKGKAYALQNVGRSSDAFYALEKANLLQDSIENFESQRSLEELETRFSTELKEEKISLQSLELEKGKQEQKTSYAIMLSLLLLLVGAAVFAISRIRGNRKLLEQKLIVEQALDEKGLLLREIHHRVKNNLQIVSSLLSIQSRNIADDMAREAVQESRDRVQSIALIHQDLYKEDDLLGIQMNEYVVKLASALMASQNAHECDIELVVDIDELNLDVDTAMPLGLILNELITNALKYAYVNREAGRLEIVLKEQREQLVLRVSDDGIGYKADELKEPGHSGFGLNMINTFSEKLKATWEITNDHGTHVEMRIGAYKRA